MILRPIVVTLKYSIFRLPLLRFATGLHIESLFVQLSRCRQFFRTAFRFCFQTLKTIQTRNASHNSFRCDAVRLLTFLVGIQLAQQLCCHALSGSWPALMDGVFDSFLFSFRLLRLHRFLCIDHRMNPLCFHFGLLLRKEVIQPHLPIRLPCYDFTPVIGLALDG